MLDWFPRTIDGTLREHYLLLFGAAGAFSLAFGVAGAWIGAWLGSRKANRRALEELARANARELEARMTGVTQQLELVALEVERMSEGHRYMAKVLADRAAGQLPPRRRDAGSATPH